MSLTSTAKELGAGMASVYRRYAEWLVSITWKRFFLLSVLLMILAGVLSGIPPFSWDIATQTTRKPASRNVDITVDEHGVQIRPKRDAASGKPSRDIIIDEHGVQMRGAEGSAPSQPAPPTPP